GSRSGAARPATRWPARGHLLSLARGPDGEAVLPPGVARLHLSSPPPHLRLRAPRGPACRYPASASCGLGGGRTQPARPQRSPPRRREDRLVIASQAVRAAPSRRVVRPRPRHTARLSRRVAGASWEMHTFLVVSAAIAFVFLVAMLYPAGPTTVATRGCGAHRVVEHG